MQDRSRRTKESIVRAAAITFASGGYRESTIAQIAASAGATTGAVYFHFSSKESIARHIVEEQHRLSTQRAEDIAHHGYSAVNTLTHLSASMGFDILVDPVIHAGTLLSTETAVFPDLYRRPWADWRDTVRALLGRGIAEGDVDPETKIESLAQYIGPAFAGVRLSSEILHQSDDLLERLREMSELLIPAFALPERKAKLLLDANEIFDIYERRLAAERALSPGPPRQTRARP